MNRNFLGVVVRIWQRTLPRATMNSIQCLFSPALMAAPTQVLERYVRPAPFRIGVGRRDIEMYGCSILKVESSWSHHSPMTILITVGAIEIGANVEKLRPSLEMSASYIKAFCERRDRIEKTLSTITAIRTQTRKQKSAKSMLNRKTTGCQRRGL